MSLFTTEIRPTEITVVVLIIALLVLLPPLLRLWISADAAWFLPYLVWLGIIGLAYWLQRMLGKHAI